MSWTTVAVVGIIGATLVGLVWALAWGGTRASSQSRPRRVEPPRAPEGMWYSSKTTIPPGELEKLVKRYVEDEKLAQSVQRPEDVFRKQPPVV